MMGRLNAYRLAQVDDNSHHYQPISLVNIIFFCISLNESNGPFNEYRLATSESNEA